MSISISVVKKSDLQNKNINIVIISANICDIACYLNRFQVFVILIKDI